MQVVFARGKNETLPDFDNALCVNNCGYYKDISKDTGVTRPLGRGDHQIVFVRRGQFLSQGTTYTDGAVIVFSPGQRQDYTYKATARCCYYWLHFSGKEASALAKQFSLNGGSYQASDSAELEKLFLSCIDCFIGNLKCKELFAVGALLSIIALVCSPSDKFSPFKRAELMLKDLSAPLSISAVASSFNMSTEHFIRSFKAYSGITPLAYRLNYALTVAKQLLSGSDMSIGEIATACGYRDALHFSRAFKKHVGLSPRAYRRSL